MRLNHLVVTAEICCMGEILLRNHSLLLELVDCALVMNIFFWEKQKLYQTNQTADLVFGKLEDLKGPC